MAKLTIQYANGRTADFELAKPEIVIGRDASCDVALDDTIISRRHARLYRDDGGMYWIQDLRSKNGTILNQSAVTAPARVRDLDRIGIGACLLTFAEQSGPTVVISDARTDTTYASTSYWGSGERLDLPQKRLEKLYDLNGRLTGLFNRDDLLNEVLEICVELLRFERAGVAVWKGGTSVPEWVRLKNLRGDAGNEFRISRSVVDRALHSGERVLINDTSAANVDPTMSMISNNIRSAMCVPIQYLQQVHGVLYGDRVTTSGGYTKEDADFFAALGQLAAMGLANVKLVEEMRLRQKSELDLQIAREIQSKLFPTEPLTDEQLHIDALNDPGLAVSGDYFDYFTRPDGLITVVIADVAGKGTPASLLMANLQAAVHVTLMSETDPARAVDSLNKLIYHNVGSSSRFITAIFGLLDPANRRLTYVNAGHLSPYLLRGDGIRPMEMEPSLPLGIELDYVYRPAVLDLNPVPVTLFMFTDGVPDAENEDGEQFGQARLVEALSSNIHEEPGEMVARVRRSIKQFTRHHPQTDDITMVAIRLS
jgi:serine phosphatase RsbU (regulator of sigma subunit)